MPTSILATKLYAPAHRPGLVARPHLMDRLDRASDRRITLVCAPAGYGKTSLVSEWLHTRRDPGGSEPGSVAWLSLDEEDNEPQRFLCYCVSAVARVGSTDMRIGREALAMCQSPQPESGRAILTSLINDIDGLPGQIVLVLDDYHLISSPDVDEFLTFLLEHKPDSLHLVIITRSDPGLALARLRAGNELTEIRAADLRFTASEVASFLNESMGLELADGEVAALEARTEGWIAGLQLAAVSLRGRENLSDAVQTFTGSNRYVMDYLIEEVLSRQPEENVEFLLNTAILGRLTGSLCDAVTGQSDGQSTLEMLERSNLFITPLDDDRYWYKYHHLFAELLRERLDRSDPGKSRELHRTAAAWFESNGFTEHAIEHALRCGDPDWAGAMIDGAVDELWQRGEGILAWRWMAKLPREVVCSRPKLSMMSAYFTNTSGEIDASTQFLDSAAGLIEGGDKTHRHLRGRLEAVRAMIGSSRGDVPAMMKHAPLALELLEPGDSVWKAATAMILGDMYAYMGEMNAAYRAQSQAVDAFRASRNGFFLLVASLKLGATLRELGKLSDARALYDEQLVAADAAGFSRSVMTGMMTAQKGELLAEMNHLDEALTCANQGVRLVERGENLLLRCWAYLSLIRVFFSRGDHAGAEEIIRSIHSIARGTGVPAWIEDHAAAWQARVWLALGETERAAQWMADEDPGVQAPANVDYFGVFDRIGVARILVAQGEWQRAGDLLDRLAEITRKAGQMAQLTEVLCLTALAHQGRDDLAAAMTPLGEALGIGEQAGFVRTFVDEGPPVARLLLEFATRNVSQGYAAHLLKAFPDIEVKEADRQSVTAANTELVEGLSERELDVLALIAQGFSNDEIGEKLFISLHTVKTHARNINAKLQTHSRMQAVSRARGLGLLPSL